LVTKPAQFVDLALEVVRELPGTSRVAGLGAGALSGRCGFPMSVAGACPCCALPVQDRATAWWRTVDEERLLAEIERCLTGFDHEA
jgi:hypothetical protein